MKWIVLYKCMSLLQADFVCITKIGRGLSCRQVFFRDRALARFSLRRRRERFRTKSQPYYMLIIWRPCKLQTAATNTLRCLKRARSHEIASSSRLAKSSGTVLDLESNVLLLRSFQSIQEVRITKESKHIRSTLAILLRAVVHRSAR